MFWTGLLVGLFVGGNLGFVLMAILAANRNDQYIPMRKGSVINGE